MEPCDPGATSRQSRGAKRDKAQVAKALQTRHFPRLMLTPSLPEIQHRQHESLICRPFQSPLTDSNRRPPPYHALLSATSRNRRQRFWLVCTGFAPRSFATGCHGLQPRGSITAPSSVCCPGYITSVRLAEGTSGSRRRGSRRRLVSARPCVRVMA